MPSCPASASWPPPPRRSQAHPPRCGCNLAALHCTALRVKAPPSNVAGQPHQEAAAPHRDVRDGARCAARRGAARQIRRTAPQRSNSHHEVLTEVWVMEWSATSRPLWYSSSRWSQSAQCKPGMKRERERSVRVQRMGVASCCCGTALRRATGRDASVPRRAAPPARARHVRAHAAGIEDASHRRRRPPTCARHFDEHRRAQRAAVDLAHAVCHLAHRVIAVAVYGVVVLQDSNACAGWVGV